MIDFDSERQARQKKLIDLVAQKNDPFQNNFIKKHISKNKN